MHSNVAVCDDTAGNGTSEDRKSGAKYKLCYDGTSGAGAPGQQECFVLVLLEHTAGLDWRRRASQVQQVIS